MQKYFFTDLRTISQYLKRLAKTQFKTDKIIPSHSEIATMNTALSKQQQQQQLTH